MGKTRLKKRNLSEVLIKKSGKSKTLNPFEIRINKQKFEVLGRKNKNDRGLPGVSRAKSIKKRKETLLQEYKIKDKTNKFIDKRIGENNAAMTEEDRILARYTAERIKTHNKKTVFNLADDEVLTHKGKTLAEIEKYDDPGSEDEEDEFGSRGGGGLDGDIVEAHFGGGMFTEKGDGAKSHASLIEELIAESKKRKAERQRAKEQTLELTEKLDSDWHELLPLVNTGKSKDDGELKIEKGSYDHLMRELKFESRGVPTDRLKSEDEVAKEEKEKLEKLEEERLRRMKGFDEVQAPSTNHKSADDLDDGFDLENEITDNENDPVVENSVEHSRNDIEESSDEDGNDDDVEEEEEGGGDDDDGGDEDEKEADERDYNSTKEYTETNIEDAKNLDSSSMKISETIKDDEECVNSLKSDESDSEDDLSDLKSNSEVECDELDDSVAVNEKKAIKSLKSSSNNDHKEFLNSLKMKKALMDAARKELPYTFKAPENYEEFESLMEGHSVDHQSIIVERIIKCHHPTLGENNKKKLEDLFTFLLQFLNDADNDVAWKLLDRFSPHIFDLTQFSPVNSASCFLEVLIEKHEDFNKRPHRFPQTDTLVFLKLVPLLFPTSDVRHQITTPAFVFCIQILNQCRVQGRRDIASGIFLISLILEYTVLSKRYCPETVMFLIGILELAVPGIKTLLPNCKVGYDSLVLESSHEARSEGELNLSFEDISSSETLIDDNFRLCALCSAIRLVNVLYDQLEILPSFKTIFRPFIDLLGKLEVNKYPLTLKEEISNLQKKLTNLSDKKLRYCFLEKKKPKALRLYEPMIEKVIDGKKRRDISEEKAEQQKLLAKYKREMKGALREIRRDNTFLAKVKLHSQTKSDEERKRKVKQIYGWGAAQEGEFKQLKRKKRH